MAKDFTGIHVAGLTGELSIHAWWYGISDDTFQARIASMTHEARLEAVKELEACVRRTTTRAYLENHFTDEGGIDFRAKAALETQAPQHRARLAQLWVFIHQNPGGTPAQRVGIVAGKL